MTTIPNPAARDEFEVKARSPALVIITMAMCYILCLSVIGEWLLRSIGKSLPCAVIFVVSYCGEYHRLTAMLLLHEALKNTMVGQEGLQSSNQ